MLLEGLMYQEHMNVLQVEKKNNNQFYVPFSYLANPEKSTILSLLTH